MEWEESCLHFCNPLSGSLRKPRVPPSGHHHPKPHSGPFLPPSPCFRTSLLLTLEGHKVREVHSCHGSWLSLDVKQRPCNHPAVLWECPVQELVPGTEFNFNGHWPSHHKAETGVGPVVEAGHGEVNCGKNGEKWTLNYSTQIHWASTRSCARHYGSCRVALSPDVEVKWIWVWILTPLLSDCGSLRMILNPPNLSFPICN